MDLMSKAGRDGGTDDDEHGQGRFGICFSEHIAWVCLNRWAFKHFGFDLCS